MKDIPENYALVELLDLDNRGKILLFEPGKASKEALYNPETHRWEWAQMTPDYFLPFSPIAGAYKKITKEEAVAKYPTILKDLEKPIDESVPIHRNHWEDDEIDPYG
jgi:hypothetical protein